MKCKHCKFVFDDNLEVCPNCRKSINEEPVIKSINFDLPMTKKEATDKLKKVEAEIPEEIQVVEEPVVEETKQENIPDEGVLGSINNKPKEEVVEAPFAEAPVEAPVNTVSTEMTAEDEFITNFIKKDDALARMKKETEENKTSGGLIVARIAALISVFFFLGVLYYTKVILPKIKTTPGGTTEIIDDYNPGGSAPANNTTGHIVIDAQFGDETIMTQLKKYDYTYDKDMSTVDITLDFGKLAGGQTFSVKLNRTMSSSTYEDDVSFLYYDAKISGIIRSYNSYNEDLITNMINTYVANEFDDGVVLYTKASTFQLGQPSMILIVKNGRFSKIEKVVTTYSLDGSSITQCPITFEGNTITYCSLQGEFKKGENVEIRRNTKTIESEEQILETINAMVSK